MTGLALGLLILSGCAHDQPHATAVATAGKAMAGKSEQEQLIEALKQQAASEPPTSDAHLALKVETENAIQALLTDAEHARADGHFDEATADYHRVLAINPDDSRAQNGLEQIAADHRHAIDNAVAIDALSRDDKALAGATVRSVLSEDPDNATARSLDRQLAASIPPPMTPRLKTRDNRLVTLEFRDANTKMVFEVLSRQTGINFVFDKDVKSDGKTTIFVQDVAVEQAIDLVLTQNQLSRQILSDNMVLIYPNTAAKQKDYQDQIVKTFYLNSATPKDVESMLKSVLEAKTLFVDERANVLVMRDTPEAVRMAEKLIAAVDVPESEVMMEVEVLEIGHNGLQQLGIAYPSQIVFTPSGAAAAAATGGVGAAKSGLVINDLGRQNGDTVGISSLNLTLDFLKQNGTTNVLASPRIRARNKEKAKVLIGSRVPVITNSVTPTAGGTAVVTGNVQYVEVGLTLEVEPTIHMNNDVAIKVKLEVSSILKEVTVGTSGTLAYQIGTRNADTLLELKDGETQLLAGLVQDNDTRSRNAVPGLGDVPYLGRLFGSNRTQKDKTELVLSITPHVIRMQPRATSEKTEFWYGTEHNAVPAASGAPPSPADDDTHAAPPAAKPPAAPPAAATPAPVPPITGAAASDPGASADAAPTARENVRPSPARPATQQATAAPPTVAGSALPTVTLDGPQQAQVGEEFEVAVRLDGQQAAGRLHAQVRVDPHALQVVSANVGSVLPGGVAAPRVQSNPSGAQVDLVGTAKAPLASRGSVLVLRLKAMAPQPSSQITAQLMVTAQNGAPLKVPPPAALVVALGQQQ